MEKTPIPGGCGFIGTNFIRFVLSIKPNWVIYNLDKLTYPGNQDKFRDLTDTDAKRYNFVKGDVRDKKVLDALFNAHQFKEVFNFAAESHVDRSIIDPDEFVMTNVIGTFQLLETSRKYWEINGKNQSFRFLHVSTDEVYVSLGQDGFFTEDIPYAPSSSYSASKASSEHFVRAYNRTHGLPTLVTNCSNNYGPYQYPEKFIPLMVLYALERKPLRVYGDGQNIRDWLYVIDHCEALLKTFEEGATGETYNIGGGVKFKNIDIVHLLCDLFDEKMGQGEEESSRSLIQYISDRPGHDRRYAINADKINKTLGWKPRFDFKKALSERVDWYLRNLEWVNTVRSKGYADWLSKNYEARKQRGNEDQSK